MLARGAGTTLRSIEPDYSHIEKWIFPYAPFSVENPNIHGVDVALEIEKSCVFPGCVQLGKFFKYFNKYFVHNSLVL